MARLRVGLIGMGTMGRHHARVLDSLQGVQLVGMYDQGPAPGPTSDGPSVKAFESLDELLSQNLDYCVVAVPTALHLDVGRAVIAAGIHALIEKPLAQDVASAQQLASEFRGAGLIAAVGHIERYNPALREARLRIQRGDLGAIYHIATRRQGPFPARVTDVGVVKDLGTHDIDSTAWVSQDRYVSVSAQTAVRSGRQHEDLVSVTAKLASGITVSHLVTWLSPFKERSTVILGERGAFVADTLSADLTYYANGSQETIWDDVAMFRGVSEGDVVRFAIPKPEPLRTEHEEFRNAVLGLPADIVTAEEGLATVTVAEAIIESAASCSTISLGTGTL